MKKTMMVAAAFAALTAGSSAIAQTGHWEWRSAPQYGPSKTNLPPRRLKVWVKDEMASADCDCAMMHEAKADCMASSRKDTAPSHG